MTGGISGVTDTGIFLTLFSSIVGKPHFSDLPISLS